jgi:thiol-disulfide isomerase/thioredoxin
VFAGAGDKLVLIDVYAGEFRNVFLFFLFSGWPLACLFALAFLSLSSLFSLSLSLSSLSHSKKLFARIKQNETEWCHACRGISQKVFGLARDRPDDLVLVKLDFDANKQLAKALGVRALPSFALFRGADGKLDLFTAGPARAALLREKVERYGAPRCVLSGAIGGGAGYEPSPELRELLEKQQQGGAAARGAEAESA